MTQFEFKEIDKEGQETLDVISKANRFNQWMYQAIKSYCKGTVLEIGSGIGNISQFFLANNYQLTLSDIRANYCETLKSKFAQYKNLQGTLQLDLLDPEFDTKYQPYFESFDTIFSLNVLEHIKDDAAALENCKKLLTKNGTLIILVPSYQWLYCQFDTELGHYRRYTKSKLKRLFKQVGYQIKHAQYFNFIGIFGWFISGKILRKKTIPAGQMLLYNKLVPIFKAIDILLLNAIGLSVIVVGNKN